VRDPRNPRLLRALTHGISRTRSAAENRIVFAGSPPAGSPLD
jgi:hypothetical protein